MTIARIRRSFGMWAALAVALPGLPADAADPPAPAKAPAPARPLDLLEKVWPGHPEWVAMAVDIVGGSNLSADDGWFRKAKTQTRFDLRSTLARYDKDGDGRVARDEFPGTDADFARLDRDRDKAIAAGDFDFGAHALAPSPGAMMFYRADADGDGKLTRKEMEAFFGQADSGRLGFLSLDDLKAALPAPAPPSGAKPAPRRNGPSKWTLLKGLYRQEIGSMQAGPRPDEVAPDFTLRTVDGLNEVTLSKLVGPKPVVLVFGNFTCGPFCSQSGNVEKLYQKYKDRAHFVMVYVREAHPTDGWAMSEEREGATIRQPRSYEERVGVASSCSRTLNLGMPMLVDTIDDAVGARYSGMPSRLYLIDGQGRVAFQNGRGPFGFKPAELEHALLLLLNDGTSAEVAKTR